MLSFMKILKLNVLLYFMFFVSSCDQVDISDRFTYEMENEFLNSVYRNIYSADFGRVIHRYEYGVKPDFNFGPEVDKNKAMDIYGIVDGYFEYFDIFNITGEGDDNFNLLILVVDNIYIDEYKKYLNLMLSVFPINLGEEYLRKYVSSMKKIGAECYSYVNINRYGAIDSSIIVVSSKPEIEDIKSCLDMEISKSLGLLGGFDLSCSYLNGDFNKEKKCFNYKNESYLKLLYDPRLYSGMTEDTLRQNLFEGIEYAK